MAVVSRLLELSQYALKLSGRQFATLGMLPNKVDKDNLYVLERCIVERVLRGHAVDRQNLRGSFTFFAGNQIEGVGPRQADIPLSGGSRFSGNSVGFAGRTIRFLGLGRCRPRSFSFARAMVVIPKAFQLALLFIVLVVPGPRAARVAFVSRLFTHRGRNGQV
jgi:hypothetical protein